MRRTLSHIIVCYWFLVVSAVAQVNVTTWHNDIGRTGQNTSEATLTTNMNKPRFSSVFSIDGLAEREQNQPTCEPSGSSPRI
jgi:hypothetical protein